MKILNPLAKQQNVDKEKSPLIFNNIDVQVLVTVTYGIGVYSKITQGNIGEILMPCKRKKKEQLYLVKQNTYNPV